VIPAATSLTLQSNTPTALPTLIPKAQWIQYRKQHDKTTARGMTGTEIAVRAANAIEKATQSDEDMFSVRRSSFWKQPIWHYEKVGTKDLFDYNSA
jgi:hypothetical protein